MPLPGVEAKTAQARKVVGFCAKWLTQMFLFREGTAIIRPR